ncbi:Asp-tRNA(Asn)/Glu-tRNA(Gln) amidotransferase subunit GatB [Ruoffia tabacinasalis]|jgi:aspartyl-tRNA(Asn)/glutamyl-tRNA(Gln) amidotransferase subunit B|uniref:Aspartyl/glutamyl-tRNA(Asn/Gln) amidotransferase subunit B n=1 Tax=Ruoffia tabacinasalis TaxID=87458 RepID=A0ABS0LI68_9LACT|nr:Asp-tRNA(Asn)/Glu-tRNA(Gln) amidotransferase subunit GatB [Ruoffia tabacinasalis]MBG9977986.1 Asp-tRNA(Asn)/Glu-tRNA(Gln) amidotransferase subunit GatB [Ruoffia tabacinasalis]HJG48291.1 Asp-tRNA(Asn)/Glu-tRNA(Gln) amidotransferase subunit GatB [Ruoffia tabacinasalis]
MNFETVIGLEIHVELKTDSKIFSTSPAHFGAEPNSNTNEKDWGYPGVLPVLNKGAVDYGMKAALALNCEIAREMSFDRKNYFYPDNPAAYQITQDAQPIGTNGYIDIEVEGERRRIRINRVHLEEDAGKNTHGTDGFSYVDLNRQGTPLIEIVSEADMHSPAEAYAYLEAVREKILFTEVSDVRMEEGSLRCDANISLRPFGQEEFGTKTELKNLNSFTYVRKGLEHEEVRQANVLRSGGVIEQETRRYDETTGDTILMRTKEGAADYRYFPEPDVPPIYITEEWIAEVKESLPEMPDQRRLRYVNEYELPEYDAMVLTQTKVMSDFFDNTIEEGADPKQVSNWLMGEVSAHLNKEQIALEDTELTPVNLAQMINLIADGTISSKIAKKLFKHLVEKGGDANKVVEEQGMVQLSDPAKLQPLIDEAIAANPGSVEDYKNGKDRALGFFVGQIMKQTRGKANPQVVNKLILETLANM